MRVKSTGCSGSLPSNPDGHYTEGNLVIVCGNGRIDCEGLNQALNLEKRRIGDGGVSVEMLAVFDSFRLIGGNGLCW